MTNNITFFSRFEADILSGKKTITIRDLSEAHFQAGQILQVFTNETARWFAQIRVKSVSPIQFTQLNATHAEQENMTLAQLQQVIRKIYPAENHFVVIEFELLNEPV